MSDMPLAIAKYAAEVQERIKDIAQPDTGPYILAVVISDPDFDPHCWVLADRDGSDYWTITPRPDAKGIHPDE